jgi:hypothetical protein
LNKIRQRIREAEAAELAPVSEAVDLMTLTSKTTELFQVQPGREQRQLLNLILKEASWKGGGVADVVPGAV